MRLHHVSTFKQHTEQKQFNNQIYTIMNISHIEHVGIAVPSLEEAIPFYEKILGLKCFAIEEVADQKVRTAFFKVGQTKIELLEGTSEDSAISKFIANNGGRGQCSCRSRSKRLPPYRQSPPQRRRRSQYRVPAPEIDLRHTDRTVRGSQQGLINHKQTQVTPIHLCSIIDNRS